MILWKKLLQMMLSLIKLEIECSNLLNGQLVFVPMQITKSQSWNSDPVKDKSYFTSIKVLKVTTDVRHFLKPLENELIKEIVRILGLEKVGNS